MFDSILKGYYGRYFCHNRNVYHQPRDIELSNEEYSKGREGYIKWYEEFYSTPIDLLNTSQADLEVYFRKKRSDDALYRHLTETRSGKTGLDILGYVDTIANFLSSHVSTAHPKVQEVLTRVDREEYSRFENESQDRAYKSVLDYYPDRLSRDEIEQLETEYYIF
jgi:hypothetical protein